MNNSTIVITATNPYNWYIEEGKSKGAGHKFSIITADGTAHVELYVKNETTTPLSVFRDALVAIATQVAIANGFWAMDVYVIRTRKGKFAYQEDDVSGQLSMFKEEDFV